MLELKDFEAAADRLKNVIHNIPLSTSCTFSAMTGAEVYLKYENQQKTGSFKVRGAYNKIMKRFAEGDLHAVVASSAGNHAQGVAFAATAAGVKSTIVMPRSAPIAKVSATQGYGAEVVPAGGGGLISGVAACAKQINPRIQIIGVQAEGAPAIANSFRTGERTPSDTVHTIADGIAVKTPGEKTFEYIKQYVDRVVTVSDDEIASAVLLLLERCKQVVETSGAAPLAAVLNNKVDVKGKKVVCVLSGGNIDVSFIHKIVEKGLITRCRQLKFSVLMPDAPGALEHFSHIVAQQNANIILFQHDRVQTDLEIGEAIIHVVCEVGGVDHAKRLIDTLSREGYRVFTSQI